MILRVRVGVALEGEADVVEAVEGVLVVGVVFCFFFDFFVVVVIGVVVGVYCCCGAAAVTGSSGGGGGEVGFADVVLCVCFGSVTGDVAFVG